jgi:hypothetical protein
MLFPGMVEKVVSVSEENVISQKAVPMEGTEAKEGI